MRGKWEFPGGKVSPGESPAQGIVREIKEELDLEVQVKTGLGPCRHNYPGLRVRLHPFVCRIVRGRVCLREHQEACWSAPGDLSSLSWAEADLQVLQAYMCYLQFRS